ETLIWASRLRASEQTRVWQVQDLNDGYSKLKTTTHELDIMVFLIDRIKKSSFMPTWHVQIMKNCIYV
ncbi:hypothetical protein ACJX0J_015823, partial [Zea mays]